MKRGIIIGAGIGGLTTAIALQKKGIEFDVYEQASALNEVGAGIWIAPNGLKVFQKLGIEKQIIKNGHFLKKIFVIDTNNKIVSKIDSEKLSQKHKFETLSIHRAALQQTLASCIPKDNLKFKKTFKFFKQGEDGVEVFFEDGTVMKGDFLINADGIRSNARSQINSNVRLRYSGQTCWRFVTEYNLYEPDNMYEIWADEKGLRAGYTKINSKQVYVFITNYEKARGNDDAQSLKSDLLRLCKNFQPIVLELIKSADETKIIRTDLFDFKPMKKWVEKRVALLGDAAHATTPNLGQGACQAIEDAYVIAEELSNRLELQDSLKSYETRRIKKATYVTNTSWLLSSISNRTGIAKFFLKNIMRITPEIINNRQLDRIYSI